MFTYHIILWWANKPKLTRDSRADPKDAVMASAASVTHRLAFTSDNEISITGWLDLILVPPGIKHGLNTLNQRQTTTTITNRLTNLYPGRSGWASSRKTFTQSHCVFVATTSLINLLHFLRSAASSLHICRIWQYFYITSLQVFFKLSHPFLQHAHTLNYVAVSM